MRRHVRNGCFAFTAAAVMLWCSGCASSKGMVNHKAMAKQRWTEARSRIIFSMARQEFEVGDLDKAAKSLAQAMEADPENSEFHELAARIYLERGQLERAHRRLTTAIELEPNRSSAHYLMGILLQRWQRYDAALAEYQLAYEHERDDVSGLLAAAEMLVKLRRLDDAAGLLEDKLVYFEHNAAIRVALGQISMLQRDFASAVKLFREASLLAPDKLELVEQLALAEYAAGESEDAIYHLKLLRDRSEQYAGRLDLGLALADCYLAINHARAAREELMNLAHAHPQSVDVWIKLAQAAWVLEDTVRVQQAARRITAMAPRRFEGYLVKGMVEGREGRSESALAHFELASRLAPDNALPVVLKGMTLERAGKVDAAIEAYKAALQISPGDARARQLLAALAP
ncbi:MAG: tetratricopeptide repeat protein [Phycisphaerae bacterium]|nr:tetratricopeptide repeat protein [Phycisphaerae bacterium]